MCMYVRRYIGAPTSTWMIVLHCVVHCKIVMHYITRCCMSVCVSVYAMSLCMCVCEWWVVSSIARCLSLTVCVCL